MNYITIDLPSKKKTEILALGAQSKSSFCFVKDGIAYLSEAGGDLIELENFKLFTKGIEVLKRKLRITPKIIACDMHPEYLSTKLANDLGKIVYPVQHHEAHLASCIVDNCIKGDIIGITFDGTGFGSDGNIWGGEFWTGNIKGFKRIAHLQYIRMPGGQASIREPWRMAVSFLSSVYGVNFQDLRIGFLDRLDKKKAGLLIQIMNKGLNSPLTSSAGRLFDAISAITGVCQVAEYEGQPAIELERTLNHSETRKALVRRPVLRSFSEGGSIGEGGKTEKLGGDRYKFKYRDEGGLIIIDWTSLIRGVVKDLQLGKGKSEISLKFHNAICYMIKEVCNLLREGSNIDKVFLTGGVFQNRYLTDYIKILLEKDGFDLYLHNKVPPHDGNIALGQAAIAYERRITNDERRN